MNANIDSTTVRTDTVRTVNASAVTVFATPAPKPSDVKQTPAIRSIDQLLEAATSSLTRRAAIAAEPSIRALHGGQIAMSINGMKVHAACIDHMDPPTAYMELASLEKLDVQAGSGDLKYGANLGGSLEFTTQSPDLSTPFSAFTTISAESNGLGRSVATGINCASTDVALRAAYTYRAAEDFFPGNNSLVVGSNYEKHNLTAGAKWQLAPSQTLSADVIYDVAAFIGFPALVMDTRRATGVIGSATWSGKFSGWNASTKFYANDVVHVMDDYGRPIEQIRSRYFMPNMHMPMDGHSTTLGMITEASRVIASGFASFVLDLSWLRARATMDMLPLDSGIAAMHLVNVGDASIGTIGMSGKYDVDFDNLTVATQVRLDVSPRTLLDQTAQSVLAGYVPDAVFSKILFGSSAAVGLHYALTNETSLHGTISTSQRMPTHLEQYGFYIFDPQPQYTTIGNPNLVPERSLQVECAISNQSTNHKVSLNVFGQQIYNYIAPDPSTQVFVGTMPPERTYGNIGTALITGAEATANFAVGEFSAVDARLGYVWARFLDVSDAMPMTPPLGYRLRYVVGSSMLSGEVTIQGAAAQTRISTIVRSENTTAPWCIGSIAFGWQVQSMLRIGITVTNILNTYYHDHLSINDFPSPGRSVRLQIHSTL